MQIFFSPFFFFFLFQRVFAALSRVKYYSLRYIYIRHSVPICLKLDLMDTRCGYYGVVLDSPDEGQISFMNVTAETDRSTHLSSLADRANVERKKKKEDHPEKTRRTPVSTNVRNTK